MLTVLPGATSNTPAIWPPLIVVVPFPKIVDIDRAGQRDGAGNAGGEGYRIATSCIDDLCQNMAFMPKRFHHIDRDHIAGYNHIVVHAAPRLFWVCANTIYRLEQHLFQLAITVFSQYGTEKAGLWYHTSWLGDECSGYRQS
jgi:hypothetical protein